MHGLPLGFDTDLDETQFYSRAEDISFLSGFLNAAKDGSTPAILLTGVRGVGKTVLMKKLGEKFSDDYLSIYIDLSSVKNFTKLSFIELFHDSIIKACEKFEFMMIDNNIPISHVEEEPSKFSDFVMNLPSEIYNEYNQVIKGVMIFFDEFQLIKDLDIDTDSFLEYIGRFIQSQKHVAYVFSGNMGNNDNLISGIAGNIFSGRILNFELNPFSFNTTKSYLSKKASFLNFTDEGIEQFYNCTGGIPFYINSFVRYLSWNNILDKETVISDFKRSLPYLVIKFLKVWYRLNNYEQRIVTSLVDKPLRRIDIAEKLEVTSGSLGAALNSLQNKVLIELEGNYYQITDNVFKLWLKTEYERRGVYPYF